MSIMSLRKHDGVNMALIQPQDRVCRLIAETGSQQGSVANSRSSHRLVRLRALCRGQEQHLKETDLDFFFQIFTSFCKQNAIIPLTCLW